MKIARASLTLTVEMEDGAMLHTHAPVEPVYVTNPYYMRLPAEDAALLMMKTAREHVDLVAAQ